jgi:type IV pilus assembly protein PilM
VNLAKILLLRETAALRPNLACEVTPAGVVAGRRGTGSQEMFFSYAPLHPRVFSIGLKPPNFIDAAAVSNAIRQAVDEVSERETKLTVVIPDTAVRVLLLDFDSLPANAAESLPIIKFRLRKLVPFETEDAAVSYQVISNKDGMVRTIVAVSPGPVRAEYESAVRAAGYEPGVVLPSTLAALAALETEEPSLLVNRNVNSVTTAITRQNQLLLYRTLELVEPDGDEGPLREESMTPFERRYAAEELQQSVSVAIAYFEDTLAATPQQLLACGPGGAEELSHLLGDSAIPAYDLVPAPATANTKSIPPGVLAGVRGALAS